MLYIAAFVADIYGAAQVQGPALNQTQSSMLSRRYLTDPDTLVDRVSSAVAEVRYCSTSIFYATVSSLYCTCMHGELQDGDITLQMVLMHS